MASDGMSIWKMPDNEHTYVVDLPTRMSDDLIKTLIASYSVVQKESQMSDTLYKAIESFLLNGNYDLLHEAKRQFEEHRCQ
jgi:hypothetical protein